MCQFCSQIFHQCRPLFLDITDKSHANNIHVKNELLNALDLCKNAKCFICKYLDYRRFPLFWKNLEDKK